MVGEESHGIFTPIEAGDYFGRENEKKERTTLQDGGLSSQEDGFASPQQTPMPSEDEEEAEATNPWGIKASQAVVPRPYLLKVE